MEEQLYWDLLRATDILGKRERNSYNGTGGRATVIVGMEGEEQLYWDWRESNNYTGTGVRGTVVLRMEGE